MRFGTEHDTTVLDENDSSVTTTNKIHDYRVMSSHKRYEIRVKVKDEQQELEEYLHFSDDIRSSKGTKLDPAFKIEHTRLGSQAGHYYVVKCWTEVTK